MNEATPKSYLYGAILFSLVIISIVSILTSFDQSEGGHISNEASFSNFNKSFNIYDSLDTGTRGIQASITNASSKQYGVFGVLNSLINTAWQALKNLFDTFGAIPQAIKGLSAIFSIPTWMTAGIGLLIIVMIAFSIWGAILQKDL